jgi:hypothetical protein
VSDGQESLEPVSNSEMIVAHSMSDLSSPQVSNKYCSEILQETLLNSVSKDLLPFMVGQSHDSFTLLSAKNVMFFSALSAGHSSVVHRVQTGGFLKQTCGVTCFSVHERVTSS